MSSFDLQYIFWAGRAFAKHKVGESKRRQGSLQTTLQVCFLSKERGKAGVGREEPPIAAQFQGGFGWAHGESSGQSGPVEELHTTQEGPAVLLPHRLSPQVQQTLGSVALVGTWGIQSVRPPAAGDLSGMLAWLL